MGTVSLVIFLFILPCSWFFWTSMSLKSGKTGKSRWRISLAALIAVVFISVGLNYYFSNTYQLSFFQNGFESTMALIVTAAFLLVITIINVIVSILFKGAPKSFHNPKAVWIFTAVFCATILFFTMWVYPLAEKASYINKVEKALALSEQQQAEEEITVLFMSSEKDCLRTTNSNCTNHTYKNAFFLKNNLDTQKEIQVRIRALDSKQKELKVIESDIMTLEAGELKLVETEESSDMESIWSRSSFETDTRVHSYESLYRYRDNN
ncbi:hypothetical protein QWY16_03715 [Planococcus shenhongbingii]|uniref:hypothetical protein n=1 Tax=Planococcus shenhongbingii TaxID=3058398 RepID=UPI0026162373|nr:hypothetical protein [Planococcus sp. N016]WKA59273.1 hypothetical protein QWY16_03715 [Planococcus sp. N016]